MTDALKKVGNLAGWHPPDLTIAQLSPELDSGRPVIAGITWQSDGSHFVLIAGIQGEGMLILDPGISERPIGRWRRDRDTDLAEVLHEMCRAAMMSTWICSRNGCPNGSGSSETRMLQTS